MHPSNFDYHRAQTVEEAIELLTRTPGAKLLAGGHSLIPMLKLRLAAPSALIDVGRISSLSGICRDGDEVVIGALTTHARLASDPELRSAAPLLAEAAAQIADPAVRNKGTIGGNIAHADPASDLPAVLVALGATIEMRGASSSRQVAAADFFVDLMTTALGEQELITSIRLPAATEGTGSCYLKVEHPASGYALCGAAAVMTIDSGRCTAATLAYNGITITPHRATGVGAALVGTPADAQAIDAAMTALAIDEPMGDLHASGTYRVQLARVYGARALAAARDRA